MKSIKLILLITLGIIFSSYDFPKEIVENHRDLIRNSLIWKYGHTVNNVFILNYDTENKYEVNGNTRYDMKIYKLDYEKSKFVPASKTIDHGEEKWTTHYKPDIMELVKIKNDYYTGGTATYKILDHDYMLLVYKKEYFLNKNKHKTYNAIVLLKYDDEYWNIVEKIKFETDDTFIIEQTYFNPKTKDRKVLIYGDNVEVIFYEQDEKYNYKIKKGKNLKR
ncbi:MAG: hypothetical protein ACOC2W_04565 [bacterium]